MKASRNPMVWAWLAAAVVTAIVGILATREPLPFLQTDSFDYFLDTYYLKLGIPGSIRTPGLPLLAGVLGYWWGLSMYQAYFGVMIVSLLVWLPSVWVLGKTAYALTGSRMAAAVCMVAYGCFPTIPRMAYCVLAESLCISVGVFYFHQLVNCLRNESVRSTAGLGAWTLVLIILKPIYIVLLPVAVALAIYYACHRSLRPAAAALGVVIAVGGCVWAYSEWWKATYGFRAISIVNTVNNTMLAYEMRILQKDDYECPETRAVFDGKRTLKESNYEISVLIWDGLRPVNPVLADCNKAVGKAIARHKRELVPYLGKRLVAVMWTIPVDEMSIHNLKIFTFLRIGMVLPLMLLTLLVVRRTGTELWQRMAYLTAAVLTLGWFIVIWIGADGSWGRLFLPAWGWLVIGCLGAWRGLKNWYEAR